MSILEARKNGDTWVRRNDGRRIGFYCDPVTTRETSDAASPMVVLSRAVFRPHKGLSCEHAETVARELNASVGLTP